MEYSCDCDGAKYPFLAKKITYTIMDKMWRYLLYHMIACIVYTDASMYSKFKNEFFYPNFVDRSPNNTVMVEYESWRITGGTVVKPPEIATKPKKVKFSGKADRLYTFCMASPDAPADFKRENYREWDHWLIVNIPGSKIEKGEEIFPYEIPSVPRKTAGAVPFVFVIYEQPAKLDINPEVFNATVKQMGLFIMKDLAVKYKLKGPEWGNYLFVEY